MSCTCCGAGCLFLTCVALGNRISVSFCLTPPTLDAMMSCSVCPVLLGPSSAALYCQSGNQPGPGQSEAELYVACDLPDKGPCPLIQRLVHAAGLPKQALCGSQFSLRLGFSNVFRVSL